MIYLAGNFCGVPVNFFVVNLAIMKPTKIIVCVSGSNYGEGHTRLKALWKHGQLFSGLASNNHYYTVIVSLIFHLMLLSGSVIN